MIERGKKNNNIAIQNILQSKKPPLLILAKFCTKKINDTMWLKEWGKKKSSYIFWISYSQICLYLLLGDCLFNNITNSKSKKNKKSLIKVSHSQLYDHNTLANMTFPWSVSEVKQIILRSPKIIIAQNLRWFQLMIFFSIF